MPLNTRDTEHAGPLFLLALKQAKVDNAMIGVIFSLTGFLCVHQQTLITVLNKLTFT